MDYRKNGKIILGTVLKNAKNIETFEKYIFQQSFDEIIYADNIYQLAYDVSSGMPLKNIFSNIKNNKLGWNHTSFDELLFNQKEQDEFIINPFEVEEGVLECKCGSKRVFSYQRQSRSSDEPMTTYAQCMSCKSQWTYSG